MKNKIERYAAFVAAVVFLVGLVVLAIAFPSPTVFQYTVFRIILAIAAAGFCAMVPGFISVRIGTWLRAGGALSIFVIVYFYDPAKLVIPESARPPISNNLTFDEILKMFAKDPGFPQTRDMDAAAQVDYARKVQDFVTQHHLDSSQRDALLQRIESSMKTSEGGNLALGHEAAGTTGGSVSLPNASPQQNSAPQDPGVPVRPPAEPGLRPGPIIHGAGLVMKLNGPGGEESAKLGEEATAVIRLRNLDSAGDSIIVTNLFYTIYRDTGNRNSENLLTAEVTLTALGLDVTVSNKFTVLPGDGPILRLSAVGQGTDLHDGPSGNREPQPFLITFPGEIKIE